MEVAAISHKKHLKIVHDYAKSAALIDLLYVNDNEPGILRLRKGKGFSYVLENKPLRKKEILDRIKRLVIPPAWEKVWICSDPKGHIQATGFDIKGRKQYRYHPLWNVLRNETKFHKMLEFGKALPVLRLQVEKDLGSKELTEKKVIATVVSLMERTYIRVGNSVYEKENGSYGLTTLLDKHVKIEGGNISFAFTGKKKIEHHISINNRRLAKIVKQCRDIPGKELFQYYTQDGTRRSIDSGSVNRYIKEATGDDYTAKDFRTWAGSLHALAALCAAGTAASQTEAKQIVNKTLEYVSERLGNTKTVCRKYYIHPAIIRSYEEHSLDKYLSQLDSLEATDGISGLTKEEQRLLFVLDRIC